MIARDAKQMMTVAAAGVEATAGREASEPPMGPALEVPLLKNVRGGLGSIAR